MTPPSTPRREASAPSTAGKQPHPRPDHRPSLEDPGQPHRTPSTMLLYPVYHNVTILCTSCTIAPPYYVPCTTARSFTPPMSWQCYQLPDRGSVSAVDACISTT